MRICMCASKISHRHDVLNIHLMYLVFQNIDYPY